MQFSRSSQIEYVFVEAKFGSSILYLLKWYIFRKVIFVYTNAGDNLYPITGPGSMTSFFYLTMKASEIACGGGNAELTVRKRQNTDMGDRHALFFH